MKPTTKKKEDESWEEEDHKEQQTRHNLSKYKKKKRIAKFVVSNPNLYISNFSEIQSQQLQPQPKTQVTNSQLNSSDFFPVSSSLHSESSIIPPLKTFKPGMVPHEFDIVRTHNSSNTQKK